MRFEVRQEGLSFGQRVGFCVIGEVVTADLEPRVLLHLLRREAIRVLPDVAPVSEKQVAPPEGIRSSAKTKKSGRA